MPRVIRVKTGNKWYEASKIDWNYNLVYINSFRYAIDFNDIQEYEVVR